MEKNIIFVKKKNFFFNKLALLLEKDGFILKKASNNNEISLRRDDKAFLFFFLESKDGISELKELKTLFGQNLNLIVFRKEESLIPDELSSAVFINLPIIYNELIKELRRINEAMKINKSQYKIGEYFFNHKTSQLIKENSSLTINLTELENKFLNYMFKKRKGATKSQILSEVWRHNQKLDTHTLESLIYRLRKKIEKNPNKPSILINDANKYLIKI